MVKNAKGRVATGDDKLTIHTTFRLPRDLHERLTKVSGDRGIGEEIRRRLEKSFDAEGNEYARVLTEGISETVSLTGQFFGDWRKDAFAFQVLKAAVNLILERARPTGEPTPNFKPDSLADMMFKATDTPENIGAMIGGMALHQTTGRGNAP